MKITGAEWKEFEDTGWPEGYVWYEDSVFDDGTDLYLEEGGIRFAADETFTIPSCWCLIPEEYQMSETVSVRSLVKKWRKDRAFVTMIVTVPKDQEKAARDLMVERGWKVS